MSPETSSPRARAGLHRRSIFAMAASLAVAGCAVRSQIDDLSTKTSHSERNRVMTMKDDLANRALDIHWPEGFKPENADLFSHNELLVNAPCERVWKHIVDATKWPEWYPNSKDVKILRPSDPILKENSVFSWTTFGLPLESKINEFVPFNRIGWFGYAPGSPPTFYHTWYLTPERDGCRVVTDEVGKGDSAVHLRESDEAAMHRGHDLWLATLKWVAEKR
jgi:hypothetical protein